MLVERARALPRPCRRSRSSGLRDAVDLVRVGVDPDDLQLLVDAPPDVGHCSRVPTASTTSAVAHSSCATGEHMRERMAVIHHALAAPVGRDRRAEPLGERPHLLGGVKRAAADEDQRALGLRQQLRGAFDRVLVERLLERAAAAPPDRFRRAPGGCPARFRARPAAAARASC